MDEFGIFVELRSFLNAVSDEDHNVSPYLHFLQHPRRISACNSR